MTGVLRALAIALLVIGVLGCIGGTRAALNDEAFYRAAAALERHAADIPFQIEYYQALGKHSAYILMALISGVVAVIVSTMLFALAAILGRLDRLEQRSPR